MVELIIAPDMKICKNIYESIKFQTKDFSEIKCNLLLIVVLTFIVSMWTLI